MVSKRRSRVLLSLLLSFGLIAGLSASNLGAAAAQDPAQELFGDKKLAAGLEIVGAPQPGDAVTVKGLIFEVLPLGGIDHDTNPVPAEFSLRLRTEDGAEHGVFGPFTANEDGTFTAQIPSGATDGLGGDPASPNVVAVEVVDAVAGEFTAQRAGAVGLSLASKARGLKIENNFTSAVGWVKPGETYPFRVIIRNYAKQAKIGVRVSVPRVDGTTYKKVTPAGRAGRARISNGAIKWNVGKMPAAVKGLPAIKTLVVTAKADSFKQDQKIVWKDLSSTATVRYKGEKRPKSSRTHGPKVVPPSEIYETARFGDRPFPVVPVDYFDRKHSEEHSGGMLRKKINSKKVAGSTFNLFQEMSFKQLYPKGGVPSAGIATADFDVKWKSERYKESGFRFTDPQPQGSCHGTTQKDLLGTPAYNERIVGGWYQLPGSTDYYGDDRYGSAIIGSAAGQGSLQAIDDACGPTGKAVFDAAHIADPEIDYSDYDTDKDGVVDFFMMVFVGAGGNGVSQTRGYDNIWPHSSSLEGAYVDPVTGQNGYVSDDQLKDLTGRKLYYTNANRSQMTKKKTKFPVYVRVGPYNVNPETAIDKASVISHEYGHSLGLPDYYSTGGRDTYGDWNLMATDKSQNMDVNAKQEMGWIIPKVLGKGTHTIKNWRDSKKDIHKIYWKSPNGKKYTLKGSKVHNGEAYVAKLPRRKVIDAKKVKKSASASHVWWSKAGNDFGCPPSGGHNLDIYLPELERLAPGTPLTLKFKSFWNIEWDYDYGFVLTSVDQGATYQSHPSEKGYTTPAAQNQNAVGCQTQYGNGITGASGSYQNGTAAADRVVDDYPDSPFLQDEYDISELAGTNGVLRFTYSTDPGLARIGWFIDDIVIEAGEGEVIYKNNFEKPERDEEIYNGGCQEDLSTAQQCTDGWAYISTSAGSPADHAYYMEMRDRSGFDANGRGENDRSDIAFEPGLLLTYTDETHGYGNAGTDDPPAQSPLDSQPDPGSSSPNLNDAAWTAAKGDSIFSDFGEGHTDNYEDPSGVDDKKNDEPDDVTWRFRFGCLSFEVLSMKGTDVNLAKNLSGNVRFKIGGGCAKYDYGF